LWIDSHGSIAIGERPKIPSKVYNFLILIVEVLMDNLTSGLRNLKTFRGVEGWAHRGEGAANGNYEFGFLGMLANAFDLERSC
jgi:hypothetical protein